MKYIIDNDLHIHSHLSLCSQDNEQTCVNIMNYAKQNNLKTICITDHFWDSAVKKDFTWDWYDVQDFEHISKILPLPQSKNVRFLFGCETELLANGLLGISKQKFDAFNFILIPITHFHLKDKVLFPEQMESPKTRADAWVKRFDIVLNMDLPFYKIGLAHLTSHLIAPTREEYLESLRLIPENEMHRLFNKASKLGVGIELNGSDMGYSEQEKDIVLRPYKIAKEYECKFYLGSDAHHLQGLAKGRLNFIKAIDDLNLKESDKFIIE